MITIAGCCGRGRVRRRCIHTIKAVMPSSGCIVTLRLAQTRDIALVLFQCCASVADDGPTFNQHILNVPSLLGALPRMIDCLRQRRPCKHETLNQCWADAGPSLRRWPKISPAFVQCLLDDVIIFSHFNKSFHQLP